MRWRMVYAAMAVVTFVGVALADTFPAIITEVKDGKVTFYKAKFNKEEKKLEKEDKTRTLPAAADVKVSKGKFDREAKKVVATDAIEGGLKSETFTTIGAKGVFATITTDDDNKKIKEIIVLGKKGGK